MKSLVSLQKDESGVIASINGDNRFVSRITSIGLTPGCKVTIVKNEKKTPPFSLFTRHYDCP